VAAIRARYCSAFCFTAAARVACSCKFSTPLAPRLLSGAQGAGCKKAQARSVLQELARPSQLAMAKVGKLLNSFLCQGVVNERSDKTCPLAHAYMAWRKVWRWTRIDCLISRDNLQVRMCVCACMPASACLRRERGRERGERPACLHACGPARGHACGPACMGVGAPGPHSALRGYGVSVCTCSGVTRSVHASAYRRRAVGRAPGKQAVCRRAIKFAFCAFRSMPVRRRACCGCAFCRAASSQIRPRPKPE
jgi:hypothetical protein